MAEGGIKFSVPRFARAVGLGGGGIDLRFDWIEQPCATEKKLGPELEDLKKENVDREVAVIEIFDDTLGAGVEGGRNDDDLMGFVQGLLIKLMAEASFEILLEVSAVGETPIDRRDSLSGQHFHP